MWRLTCSLRLFCGVAPTLVELAIRKPPLFLIPGYDEHLVLANVPGSAFDLRFTLRARTSSLR